MEKCRRLEFLYAKRLRESNSIERRKLYGEAYSIVSGLTYKPIQGMNPAERTAGTTKRLIQQISQLVNSNDTVLEVGCGRGYTCLMLAQHVQSMVGTDVSEPSLVESIEILENNKVRNVSIKKVSAFELRNTFENNEFNVCISIDVLEHLHHDDAVEHLQQVLQILKPGGKYIIVCPNRLSGPHDITREEFPNAKEALGFHLNETNHRELAQIMRKIGFKKLQIFFPLALSKDFVKPLVLPLAFGIFSEIMLGKIPKRFLHPLFEKVIALRIIGHKAAY